MRWRSPGPQDVPFATIAGSAVAMVTALARTLRGRSDRCARLRLRLRSGGRMTRRAEPPRAGADGVPAGDCRAIRVHDSVHPYLFFPGVPN